VRTVAGRGPAEDELPSLLTGGRVALSAALLGRVARRLPAAAAASWVGMGSLVCALLLASSCSSQVWVLPVFFFFLLFVFLFEGFFSAVESDLIAQECAEEKRGASRADWRRTRICSDCIFPHFIATAVYLLANS
jgi:hypothetical protein